MANLIAAILSERKIKKELKKLSEKSAKDPQNFLLQIRIGDLHVKMGKKAEAVQTYRSLAEECARAGLFRQAMALYKIIIRLDPLQTQLYDELAKICSQKKIIPQQEADFTKVEKSQAQKTQQVEESPEEGVSGDSIPFISHIKGGTIAPILYRE